MRFSSLRDFLLRFRRNLFQLLRVHSDADGFHPRQHRRERQIDFFVELRQALLFDFRAQHRRQRAAENPRVRRARPKACGSCAAARPRRTHGSPSSAAADRNRESWRGEFRRQLSRRPFANPARPAGETASDRARSWDASDRRASPSSPQARGFPRRSQSSAPRSAFADTSTPSTRVPKPSSSGSSESSASHAAVSCAARNRVEKFSQRRGRIERGVVGLAVIRRAQAPTRRVPSAAT